MFTGLIQHCGVVVDRRPSETGASLTVDTAGWSHRPQPGDSIAVNGCCLTVAATAAGDTSAPTVRFDVVDETLQRTTLNRLQPASHVNLEHAATPETMLGGHIVQGHVDGCGTVISFDHNDGQCRLRIAPPDELHPYIIEKGSITVDGVSLTIAGLHDDRFEVALIPTTLERTTLAQLSAGDAVNLEADYIAKIVVHNMQLRRA